ncbi:hypothetical protein HID58_081388, partial [Brassica napus]
DFALSPSILRLHLLLLFFAFTSSSQKTTRFHLTSDLLSRFLDRILLTNMKKDGGALSQSRRGFHVELGAREKDLLAENDALRRFKSHKRGMRQLKRVGDVITDVVVADRDILVHH